MTLGSNASCTAEISFKPASRDSLFATLWVYSDAPRSPHAVSLTGVGAASASTGALPAPWTSKDVGSVGAAGSASFSTGVFTIRGSGADIWGTADEFRFVYKTLSGDGELVARVSDLQSTHKWAKAGVMIRSATSANAAHAMMLVSAVAGTAFQYRKAAGGSSVSVSGGSAIRAPYWIKVARAGTVISGYQSADGSTWTRIGSATIAMSSSVKIGLAVSSHIDARLSKATFDHVVSR